MRRILHLRTVSGKGGGPEKTLLATPKHIGTDYDVRLAYIRPRVDPDYNMPERARELGVELVDIPESGPVDPRTLIRAAAEVRRYRPHLLHAHDYKTNVLSIVLGRWFKIPVVTTLHGYVTLGGRLNLYYRVDRWALRRMSHSVAVSPDLYDFLGGLGIPEARRSFIENAIDTNFYCRGREAAECKAQFGFGPQRLLVGAVGRLQPEKGFDLLIRAADALFAQGNGFDLVIAGEGPERGRLENLIRELGREDRIKMLGFCSQTLDLYQALDVFVLSSLREGLPNVLLEAMALEVPVVSTKIAGVPGLVAHGQNGLLVPPGDASELGMALKTLLWDASLRSRLATAARATIEQRYSFTRRMEKIRGVYDAVLQ